MKQQLQTLLNEHFARAICFTLLHSLWQGILLVLITKLILALAKKAAPSIRYGLLTSMLFLFSLGNLYTFVRELSDPYLGPLSGPASEIMQKLTEAAPLVTLIWMLLVTLRSLNLCLGLYRLHRFKHQQTKPVNNYWSGKLNTFATNMGIGKVVTLLESGLAKTPLLIGYIKPVILIPVGLLNNLPPEELEAILLHELAHIRRADYLFNILQSLIETLLFFNPAVLWLGKLIRAERENCCDELVISQTGNKLVYIRALVHSEEQAFAAPPTALAFGGNRNSMLLRLQRLIGPASRPLHKLEIVGIFLLFLVTIILFAARPGHPIVPLSNRQPPSQFQTASQLEMAAKKKAETEAVRQNAGPHKIP